MGCGQLNYVWMKRALVINGALENWQFFMRKRWEARAASVVFFLERLSGGLWNGFDPLDLLENKRNIVISAFFFQMESPGQGIHSINIIKTCFVKASLLYFFFLQKVAVSIFFFNYWQKECWILANNYKQIWTRTFWIYLEFRLKIFQIVLKLFSLSTKR